MVNLERGGRSSAESQVSGLLSIFINIEMSRQNLLMTQFFKVIKNKRAIYDEFKENITILSDCSKIADKMQSR